MIKELMLFKILGLKVDLDVLLLRQNNILVWNFFNLYLNLVLKFFRQVEWDKFQFFVSILQVIVFVLIMVVEINLDLLYRMFIKEFDI